MTIFKTYEVYPEKPDINPGDIIQYDSILYCIQPPHDYVIVSIDRSISNLWVLHTTRHIDFHLCETVDNKILCWTIAVGNGS